VKTDDLLRGLGVSSERHYFENSLILGNVYTVYLLLDENDDILSRGIAICSVSDQHEKKEGIHRARGRAIKALYTKKEVDLKINSVNREYVIYTTRGFNISKMTIDATARLKNEIGASLLEAWESHLDGKEMLFVRIPNWLPTSLTQDTFDYKSYYKPVMTQKEKLILKKK